MNADFSRRLRQVARLWGLHRSYIDTFGRVQQSPETSLLRILESLIGMNPDNPGRLEAEFWRQTIAAALAPVQAIWDGKWKSLFVWLSESEVHDELVFELELEDGTRRELNTRHWVRTARRPRLLDGKKFVRVRFELNENLPLGYHKLKWRNTECLLIAAPVHGQQPAWVKEKNWGVFAPTYALRSVDDWGMGTLRELKNVAASVHEHGGQWVGTLPMLACDWSGDNPDPSPYNPVSRLFWNENFLDLHKVLKDYPADVAVSESELEQLRTRTHVDHRRVHQLIEQTLQAACDAHFETRVQTSKDFQEFLKKNPSLIEYATFMAKGDPRKIRYHQFVQYLIDRQLNTFQKEAHAGKCARLYLDYTVGVSRDGFDVHKFGACFLPNAAAGAPPDRLFVSGQNWGFQPFHPIELRRSQYRYLIQALRCHFRHCDLLRLDHVMGLQRIYSIPDGVGAGDGVYMRFNLDEGMAILCLEAARARALVIGEDLGTVSPIIRQHMTDHDLKRLWVFQFMMNDGPQSTFENVPPNALVSFNTHDLAPFAGFWRMKDIDWLKECGLIDEKRREEMREERRQLKLTWQNDLNEHGLDGDNPQALHEAFLRRLFQSQARFISINAEDLWGEEKPQNIPGTHRQYPNWRQRFPLATLKPDFALDAHLNKVVPPV